MASRRVTLADVARLAGVHPATASRALNQVDGSGLVSPATVARVTAAANRLGYRPNPVARSLRTRRSHTVGVVIPDLANPLFPPVIRGIEDRLAEGGYVALLANTDDDPARERQLLERMRERHVDGLVLATVRRGTPEPAGPGEEDLPVVLVNRVAEDRALPAVAADDVSGIRLAVAHLVSLGHRRIGHVAGPQDLSTGAGRLRGFRLGMAEQGLEVGPTDVVVAERYQVAEGLRCARQLLAQRPRVTAIVAANDMLALGCYRALAEAGLACPQDCSVVGFNDMPFVDQLSPPLTSVRFDHYAMGREAAQLILERLATPGCPTKVVYLPPELVVRASTGPAPRGGLGAGGGGGRRRAD
ncbi:LacI family DNA-binding transcriptional regulator [Aciditerrimonas ferrireducens]|uniref:LacI family DNA-binding transcriptional regulator n=1 Tax=Aciditerrimonas ferrireducens TaxID=667306 RepID=UPI0020044527|nr:LacI family DNA-binding transcriptional regulator [Aciditerrimonas ferrireducens]MCK4176155.1 LacI family transcriptional regulator [Aciditerrimonas ferrireducens]